MLNDYIFEKCGRCLRKAWLIRNKNASPKGITEGLDFPKMPKGTMFNHRFEADFGECVVDAVVPRGSSVELYDFHPSVKYARFFASMNYKRAVAKASGAMVRSANIISVNPEYLPGGTARPYVITPVPEYKHEKVFIRSLKALSAATSAKKAPEADLESKCSGCEFFKKCFSLPDKNIFSLVNLSFEKKLELYNSGIVTFDDYMKNNPSPLCAAQINGEAGEVINKKELKRFLESLKKPLCFLDFETIMPLVPEFPGYHPHEIVVTQFSFHRKRGKKLTHAEFLGDGIKCPEEPLVKALITAAGAEGSILMYSQYEKTCIEILMSRFPQYEKQLGNIKERLVDLEAVFKNKIYYNKKMNGRSSLKIVVPALFPGDKEFDYSNTGVNDGGEAAKMYCELKNLSRAKRKERREELLKYCRLDTYAMVKIIEKLEDIVSEKNHD